MPSSTRTSVPLADSDFSKLLLGNLPEKDEVVNNLKTKLRGADKTYLRLVL
jgi:hypothetical protein